MKKKRWNLSFICKPELLFIQYSGAIGVPNYIWEYRTIYPARFFGMWELGLSCFRIHIVAWIPQKRYKT